MSLSPCASDDSAAFESLLFIELRVLACADTSVCVRISANTGLNSFLSSFFVCFLAAREVGLDAFFTRLAPLEVCSFASLMCPLSDAPARGWNGAIRLDWRAGSVVVRTTSPQLAASR